MWCHLMFANKNLPEQLSNSHFPSYTIENKQQRRYESGHYRYNDIPQ